MCVKQLFPINTTNLSHSSVKFDKEFLNKKLKEILPSKINKYASISYTKNKDLIKHLKYFQELFEYYIFFIIFGLIKKSFNKKKNCLNS